MASSTDCLSDCKGADIWWSDLVSNVAPIWLSSSLTLQNQEGVGDRNKLGGKPGRQSEPWSLTRKNELQAIMTLSCTEGTYLRTAEISLTCKTGDKKSTKKDPSEASGTCPNLEKKRRPPPPKQKSVNLLEVEIWFFYLSFPLSS